MRQTPSFRRERSEQGIDGDVGVTLTIDANGAALDALVVNSPSSFLNEAALSAARSIAFKPAVNNGAKTLKLPA